jgi:hypothetical protein
MCPAVSDLLPKRCERIEVRVAGLTQLFHAMDPSKLRYRDLDPDAEAFITDWAREVPSSLPLGLTVLVEGKSGLSAEPGELREAIGGFFCRRAALARRRLRDLFHRGRTSLFIGVGALACSMTAGDVLGRAFSHHVTDLVREGLLIGGWVAMWRPMENFSTTSGQFGRTSRSLTASARCRYKSATRRAPTPPVPTEPQSRISATPRSWSAASRRALGLSQRTANRRQHD